MKRMNGVEIERVILSLTETRFLEAIQLYLEVDYEVLHPESGKKVVDVTRSDGLVYIDVMSAS